LPRLHQTVFVLLNIFVAIMSNAYEVANAVVVARIAMDEKRGFKGVHSNISLPVLKWLTLLPALLTEARSENRRARKQQKRLLSRANSGQIHPLDKSNSMSNREGKLPPLNSEAADIEP
jgi:hypothetical protein